MIGELCRLCIAANAWHSWTVCEKCSANVQLFTNQFLSHKTLAIFRFESAIILSKNFFLFSFSLQQIIHESERSRNMYSAVELTVQSHWFFFESPKKICSCDSFSVNRLCQVLSFYCASTNFPFRILMKLGWI